MSLGCLLGDFPRDIPMQEVPDFIGLDTEIWVRSYLRADLVPHRARAVPAHRGARLRQAARSALILTTRLSPHPEERALEGSKAINRTCVARFSKEEGECAASYRVEDARKRAYASRRIAARPCC